jgi:hypothetical protein
MCFLLQKLIVALLVKKFSLLLLHPQFHYRVRNNPQSFLTLSHLNPIDILPTDFFSIYFNIALPVTVSRLSDGLELQIEWCLQQRPAGLVRLHLSKDSLSNKQRRVKLPWRPVA